MTDQEFLHAFETGRLAPSDFHHRDHLRLAWLQVQRLGADAAAGSIAEGIRRFAEAHGQSRLYHDTLTRFWVRIVAHVTRPTFEQTPESFPRLLDKDLPLSHWRRETLFADAARARWVEPDLLPLP